MWVAWWCVMGVACYRGASGRRCVQVDGGGSRDRGGMHVMLLMCAALAGVVPIGIELELIGMSGIAVLFGPEPAVIKAGTFQHRPDDLIDNRLPDGPLGQLPGAVTLCVLGGDYHRLHPDGTVPLIFD